MPEPFTHSQFVYKKYLDHLIEPGTRWLDIGCGDSVLADWLPDSVEFQQSLIRRAKLACGCDPVDDRPHRAGLEKYVGPCEVLPYKDGSFDVATANMVVEHVERPGEFAREVGRVLRDGGRLLLHTPNLLFLPILFASMLPSSIVRTVAKFTDGRKDEEIFPTRYRLNTREAISSLPGFRVEELLCVETAPVLEKIPVAGAMEKLLVKSTRWEMLQDLRADWIGVLRKCESSSGQGIAGVV